MRAFVSLLLLASCQKDSSPPLVDASFAAVDVGFVHAFAPAPEDAGSFGFDAGDPNAVVQSKAKSGKSVGHTSVVFKVKLESGVEICFKPESKRGRTRYRGEIAAYRLAAALGLPNVIPAMPRTFDANELRGALDPAARKLFDEEAMIRGGKVRGAAMPWLQKLELIPLESPSWRARWSGWLAGADIPEDQRTIAAQISTLVVFDLLTGNWDRYSGANVGIDRPTSTLVFIDNDGAFFDPPPAQPLAAQTAMLRKTARFSRSLVAALRRLEPVALADAIGEETPGVPLLSASVLAGVAERRKLVIDHIDALINERGETAVLAFP